jgi:hypothetical protein
MKNSCKGFGLRILVDWVIFLNFSPIKTLLQYEKLKKGGRNAK